MNPFTMLASAPFLALLLCVVLSFVVGSVWYGPLFGKKWMALTGMTKEKMEGSMGRAFTLEALSSLLLAFGLYYFATIANLSTLEEYLWLGFMATICIGVQGSISRAAWETSSLKLTELNGSGMMVTILGMCAILYYLG